MDTGALGSIASGSAVEKATDGQAALCRCVGNGVASVEALLARAGAHKKRGSGLPDCDRVRMGERAAMDTSALGSIASGSAVEKATDGQAALCRCVGNGVASVEALLARAGAHKKRGSGLPDCDRVRMGERAAMDTSALGSIASGSAVEKATDGQAALCRCVGNGVASVEALLARAGAHKKRGSGLPDCDRVRMGERAAMDTGALGSIASGSAVEKATDGQAALCRCVGNGVASVEALLARAGAHKK
ncbi:hypothetical protein DAPPUDRAFT_123630, partial [Daphnia pulex]